MQSGTITGHYRILRPLGKGGMGEVYLAEDTKLQRQVATTAIPIWRQPLALGFAAVMLVIGILGAWLLKPEPPEPPPRLRTFTLPIEAFVNALNGPALSPDGTMIAYTKVSDNKVTLWIHDLAQGIDRELTGTADGAQRPFWSPDSRTVGYFENPGQGGTTLRTVSNQGGPATPVCELPAVSYPRGAVWMSDGQIVFSATQKYCRSGRRYPLHCRRPGRRPWRAACRCD